MQKFIFCAALASVSALLAGCPDPLAPGVQADFFECPPNNTLRVCAAGTAPPPADMCEPVGSGTTTFPAPAC